MRKRCQATIAKITVFLGFLVLLPVMASAQEMPPAPVQASIIRGLSFGALTQGVGGGSVILYPSGTRISMGDIILVDYGYLYYPAIFELSGNPGTIVHFLVSQVDPLTSVGGGWMTMTVGETDPVTPFILPTAGFGTIQIFVGGTLTVGSPLANPGGDYTGSFDIMFIQE